MNLLAVDPGNVTGWALFRNGLLEASGSCGPSGWGNLTAPGFALIEMPTIYPHSKADPNRIMKLQMKVGELKARFEISGSKVELVEPRTWKGRVPKEVMKGRTIRKLSAQEYARIPTGAPLDTWDAVALGLWRIGR